MEEHIRKQVKAIDFSLISPEQIKKLGVAKIVTPELYDMDGYPIDGGLMDLRLGAIDPGVRCRTCGGKLKELVCQRSSAVQEKEERCRECFRLFSCFSRLREYPEGDSPGF